MFSFILHNVLSLFFSMAGAGLGCWVRSLVGSLGPRGLGPRGLGVDSRLCMRFVVCYDIYKMWTYQWVSNVDINSVRAKQIGIKHVSYDDA